MVPTLPVVRALAIAGDRIAGGVGTHEPALASPDRVDLGGRCGPTEDEMVDASREGVRIAIARGVTAVHDKDGWLGALGVWQRLREEGHLNLRVWQSIPAEQVDELAELRIRSGFGDDLVRIGYL